VKSKSARKISLAQFSDAIIELAKKRKDRDPNNLIKWILAMGGGLPPVYEETEAEIMKFNDNLDLFTSMKKVNQEQEKQSKNAEEPA